jgi:hypothetical protein
VNRTACWMAMGCFLFVHTVSAQDINKNTVDRLLQRLADSERRIQALEERLASLPGGAAPTPAPQAAAALPPTPLAPAPSVPAPLVAAPLPAAVTAAAEIDHSSHDGSGPLGHIQFQGFGDFSYYATAPQAPAAANQFAELATGHTNTFAVGELDLFITDQISKKFSFLAETSISACPYGCNGGTNESGIEVERVMLTYKPSEYFQMSFGRFHSMIGYYDITFHHATWLQNTVDRPFLFAFEDHGGILPVHNVGLTTQGKLPSGSWNAHWAFEVGNGRASNSLFAEPVQNNVDENNGKTFNFAAWAKPDWAPGMEFGGSVYHDRLYPDGASRISQTISSAHVVYNRSGNEFLNEVVVENNNLLDKHATIHTTGFYSQVSHRMGSFRPYFRYEYLNVNQRDPIFGFYGRRNGPLGGIRWDAGDFTAFKIQIEHLYRTGFPVTNLITGQVSFAF